MTDDQDQSDTIATFCEREKISRTQFYKLRQAGKGPRVFYIGTRPHISPEARREWRLKLEAEAAERDKSSHSVGMLAGAEVAA